MQTYSIADQIKIEKAIIFASAKFALCNNLAKPTLLHAVRVGSWLYFHRYDPNIVIAGFLHDIIEDTNTTEQEIGEVFGKKVSTLVTANTKNANITEKKLRNDELIKRCLAKSEKAAIVKAADILDNYMYYINLNDKNGIDYCKNNAASFKRYFNNSYKDKIFSKFFEEVK